MAKTNSAWSILVGVELDTSGIQSQLNDAAKNLSSAGEDMELSFQAANMIWRESLEIITSMVDQVYELDDALTEFKKVSDLSGESLDGYVDQLSRMGDSVARTGKPKRMSRGVQMINVRQEPFKNQKNLKPVLLQ